MQIIMSPSKTQHFTYRDYREYSMPNLLPKAHCIIDRLKPMREQELAELMKTSDILTQSTYRRIQSFAKKITLQNGGQAVFTFQGDAFAALSAERLTPDELQYAQKHLFILSGLYGVLRPLDLIQPYRLEMATPLSIEQAKNLYAFWSDPATEFINKALIEDRDRTLVNLASAEYAKVINKKNLKGRMVTITFKQKVQDTYRTIPIHSKKARGLMARYFITRQISEAEGLRDFKLDGYDFSAMDSTPEEWCFVKKE